MNKVFVWRPLGWVWLALMLLLAITAGTAFLHLGAGNSIINLAIAAAKVGLIAVFFMHLRQADNAMRLAFGTALLLLFVLAFLSFSDVLSR
jgi:cytochrome c oxidase subunit IV